jgi:putative endonuclease
MLREGRKFPSIGGLNCLKNYTLLGWLLLFVGGGLKSKSKSKREYDMYTLYIIYSKIIDQYYSGQTNDLNDRLRRHNEGRSLATKRGVPWELKKAVDFETRSEAMNAENWLKRMKSRKVIEKVIAGEIDLKEVID